MKQSVRILSLYIVLFLLLTGVNSVNAASGVPLKERYTYSDNENGDQYSDLLNYPYYSAYIANYKEYRNKVISIAQINLEADKTKVEDGKAITLRNDIGNRTDPVFVWNDEFKWVEWEFDVVSKGLYEVEIKYYMLPGTGNPAVRSLRLNGNIPFVEAGNIVFERIWRDSGEPVINSIGDETRPSQVEVPYFRNIKLVDGTGFYSEPLNLYLETGKNTIRLEYIAENIAISSISLVPAEIIPSYEDVKETYNKNEYNEAKDTIIFEAESSAVEKNNPTIRRETDGDPIVTPPSYINRKLNVIGGWRWRTGNQSITWEFEVPENGLYKIGIKAKQNWNDGLPSYRQIAIDGKVPFKELMEYRFEYDKSWKLYTLESEENGKYLFYLSKGIHRITMTVELGPVTSILQSLNDDVLLLSSMIRDIIKITGNNPDPNYDYEFFKTIPNLKENMEKLIQSLYNKYETVSGLSKKVPAMANNFLSIKKQLEDMINDPFSIASRMNEINGAQSSLGTWYISLQNQPLLVDSFKVGIPSEEWKQEKANVLQKLKFSFLNFLASFKKDYNSIGSILKDDTEVKSTINVWIARGTEWAEIIKEMADEEFTPQTGILVNINVLPASQLHAGNVNALMLSIISGRAPDVGMGLDSGSPVEFAIRNAVYDLAEFDDFNEVSKRFLPNILTPYRYNEGVFAIPETMDFSVMFYRKDIVNELDIKIPDTREELYSDVLPALYQNSLQFYYPQDFTQFIFQHGGDYYTPDGRKSGLDTSEAFRAFQEYTELFTHYGMPLSASFYNRMRTGEMPIGIGSFGLYMQLSVAAPELVGKWGIAPLPGRRLPDGTINRSNGALAGQCNVIMKQSDRAKESWEFLKWWSSADVQTKFARELEALIGAEARWNTANVEAFNNLSWKAEALKVINEQWRWSKETPVVLGGYFTGRYITNAWNTVVLGGGNVRDSLENAVKEINRELRMKQEEYGIHENHE